jgi:ergothioneine biosynthesis protein EgtB
METRAGQRSRRASHEPALGDAPDRSARFRAVRAATERLCEDLTPEDCTAQSMPEASPIKWHLAHTSWFFETFVLAASEPTHRPFHPRFSYLFNSYYNAVGERVARAQRGLITRPSLDEVMGYRRHVDERVNEILASGRELDARVLELGCQHEEQHQELVLTDVKHLLSQNPLRPAYRRAGDERPSDAAPPLRFLARDAGLHSIGHAGDGFAFDNESPRHREFVEAFAIASRPATNGEYLAFMEDDGYARPELWLSDGWDAVTSQGWRSPLYWERDGECWHTFTLRGIRELDPSEPVCHVSYYEADAFARWAHARLPRESEWEVVASDLTVESRDLTVDARDLMVDGNFVESGALHPRPTRARTTPRGAHWIAREEPCAMFGDVWEWTQSAYCAYPGYVPVEGALGEYNGKFMVNQMVLRGGSCASPRAHLRATYRNFFPPAARWQFSGIRLARDVK